MPPTTRSGRHRSDTIEICMVPVCPELVQARGLCKRHYTSLSRALKSGQNWDIQTGQVIVSPHRPRPPFEQPPQLEIGNTGYLGQDTLEKVRAQVEVDAARALPHALAFCVADMLRRGGLAHNPDALAAFDEAVHNSAPAALNLGPKGL